MNFWYNETLTGCQVNWWDLLSMNVVLWPPLGKFVWGLFISFLLLSLPTLMAFLLKLSHWDFRFSSSKWDGIWTRLLRMFWWNHIPQWCILHRYNSRLQWGFEKEGLLKLWWLKWACLGLSFLSPEWVEEVLTIHSDSGSVFVQTEHSSGRKELQGKNWQRLASGLPMGRVDVLKQLSWRDLFGLPSTLPCATSLPGRKSLKLFNLL